VKMKYYCKDCGQEYTLPAGDLLIEKNKQCKCGKSTKLLALKKTLIIESHLNLSNDFLFKLV